MILGNPFEHSRHGDGAERDAGNIVIKFLQFVFKPVWDRRRALFRRQACAGEPGVSIRTVPPP